MHNGHLALAENARKALGLDEVWLLPVSQQPLKSAASASSRDRSAMCGLATGGKPWLAVCDVETRTKGPSYSVDTLRQLSASHPKAEWYFIAGSDAVAQIMEWKQPLALLDMCQIAVVERGGTSWSDLEVALPKAVLTGLIRLQVPTVEVSSTEIREKLARGESIDRLVPPAVAEYVQSHKLYE